jgi:asparagine N-glycosylation enzyme membrane subunit Stt3
MTPQQRDPLWWRVLAWLPEQLFIDCAVCLFWRGAVVGFGIACAFALVLLVLLEV